MPARRRGPASRRASRHHRPSRSARNKGSRSRSHSSGRRRSRSSDRSRSDSSGRRRSRSRSSSRDRARRQARGSATSSPRPSPRTPTTPPGSPPSSPPPSRPASAEGAEGHSPARDAATERTCSYPRCKWRGAALWSHWHLAHGGALAGGRHTLDVPVRSPSVGLGRGVAVTRLLRTRGRLFALHLRRQPGHAELLGCVQLLGRPAGRAFVYQLKVLDGADRPRSSLVSEVTVAEATTIKGALRVLCVLPAQAAAVPAASASRLGAAPSTAPDSVRIRVHLRESPFERQGGE